MANTVFYVPKLKMTGAWSDVRGRYPGGYTFWWQIPLSNHKKIILHHTDTWRQGNMYKELDYVKKIHMDINKWGGIGYHFIISSEEVNGYAKVAYVGDIALRRAHALNNKGAYGIPKGRMNEFSIGISMIGRFQHQDPTPAQLRSLHELVKELVFHEDGRLPNLVNDYNKAVGYHKFVDYTACPVQDETLRRALTNPPALPGKPEPKPKPKPQPVDEFYRVLGKDGKQLNAYKDKDIAFNFWYDDTSRKVTYKNKDITSEFKTMATKLEKEIAEKDTQLDEAQKLLDDAIAKREEAEKKKIESEQMNAELAEQARQTAMAYDEKIADLKNQIRMLEEQKKMVIRMGLGEKQVEIGEKASKNLASQSLIWISNKVKSWNKPLRILFYLVGGSLLLSGGTALVGVDWVTLLEQLPEHPILTAMIPTIGAFLVYLGNMVTVFMTDLGERLQDEAEEESDSLELI